MIVTTSQRANAKTLECAVQLADLLRIRYVERKKQPVQKLAAFYKEPVLLVSKERLELHHPDTKEPFFFHPGSAMFRVKRLLSGGEDELVKTCGLTAGMAFLDCTMGPAADSITAAAAVGALGRVESLEASKTVALIVEDGLQRWEDGPDELLAAMKRICVKAADYHEYLETVPDNSFDVVYFDPMFQEPVESEGIAPLRPFASRSDLTKKAVAEATRIARQKVVLKDHFRSNRFDRFGFHQQVRKTSKFHFGVIDCIGGKQSEQQ